MKDRYCLHCGKVLTGSQKKFCSRRCYGKNLRGTGTHHIRIRVNGERIYQHRYLVEKHVRPLKDGEIVHHKDENKFNNSLDNLEILSGQAAHLHMHDYYRGRRGSKSVVTEEDFAEFGF